MKYLYKNKKINYVVTGKGKPVVFIHGFTESIDIWKSFSAHFRRKYKCLLIDLPGHGKSDCLDNEHGMEESAHIIKEILDFNKIKKCVLIGHSMGGYILLAFAEAFPNMLQGLCLFHSSAMEDTDEIKQNREKTIDIVKHNKFNFLSHFIPSLFASENKERLELHIKELIKEAEQMNPKGIINAINGMKIRKDRRDVLKALNVPVLFIAGKKDSRIPVQKLTEQIILPKISISLFLENTGHMGYLEEPEMTRDTLDFFIKKCYNVI